MNSMGSDLDSALDSMGFSYLDGIPVQLSPEYQIHIDLTEVNELLEKDVLKSFAPVSYDWSAEKQLLDSLRAEDERRRLQQEEEDRIIEEYLKKKKEKKKAEAEAAAAEKAKEKEEKEGERPAAANDEEESSSASAVEEQSTSVNNTNNNNNGSSSSEIKPKINYSEFEAEADPFDTAELQTINDLKELAACFPTTTTTTPNVVQQPIQFQYPQYYIPPQLNHYQQTYQDQQHSYSHQSQGLKSSKSFGDITQEIKKEEITQYYPPPVSSSSSSTSETTKRLSSRTPPPRVSSIFEDRQYTQQQQKSRPLDDWIPWPDLDFGSKKKEPKEEDALENLSEDSKALCRQLAEMGFPLDRLARASRALGDDSQQMINYCLLVDKFLGEKFPLKEVEHVLLIHSVNEESSRRHLMSFVKLSDIGFDRMKIHDALITNESNYDKALEHLLK